MDDKDKTNAGIEGYFLAEQNTNTFCRYYFYLSSSLNAGLEHFHIVVEALPPSVAR